MADNLPPSCAVVTKSGNINFLEPSGSFWARNGTDLPLLLFSENRAVCEMVWKNKVDPDSP